ncbi:MAG: SDR family oxidoreductase [Polyangiaceae bacterium]
MHVAITGASRGIGRASALRLAARGARLTLLGRPSAALDSLQRELRAQDVEFVPCDLAERDDVARAGQRLAESTPDVLVNNAAIIERAALDELSPESFERQLAVNLVAPAMLCRAVLPGMRARGSGRLLFVASISATLGTARATAYNASKWGLVGLMKSLGEELSGSGLMTCAILPGSVDTEMLAGSGFPARMSSDDVARTLEHYALDAPVAHNGASIEMFGT